MHAMIGTELSTARAAELRQLVRPRHVRTRRAWRTRYPAPPSATS
jgi:hypothetical protein